jgi:tRNA nucleotidyltransferase (CCA-adding enzyme)
MNSTKVEEIVQKVIQKIYSDLPIIKKIIADLHTFSSGVRIILVGGSVRDAFLDLPIKDLDIEVYGVALEDLEKLLRMYGVVRRAGKVFGVLRIDGLDIDWSLPRTDGPGRHPVTVHNPELSYQVAFARRDLTINAMGIDFVSGVLIDPFNGLDDLKNKILKVPNAQFFKEDPLRYFRVMQFMARFEFTPDAELYEIGTSMDFAGLSHERITQEFYKLLVFGKKPSLGLQWLADTKRLQEVIPELYALIGLEQDSTWHPEGDVFEHTKQAVDCAALQQYSSDQDRYGMTLAALCHDLGKATTTKVMDGRIRSLGHDVEGVGLAEKVLQRICKSQSLHSRITKLVRWHMTPFSLVKNNAGAAAYKRLAFRLAPETSCAELGKLVLCDKSGRNPDKNGPLPTFVEPLLDQFLAQAEQYGVLHEPEKPLLSGKDFLDIVPEGKEMGNLLRAAYEIQIERGILARDELKKMVLKKLKM